MSFDGTASQIGATTNAIEQLLSGYATDGVADALGVSSSAIQKFLDGRASDSIAGEININSAELQHIRNELDRSGAVGFILGLALARSMKSTG